jgi:hypothetical protein
MPKSSLLMVTCFTLTSIPRSAATEAVSERIKISPLTGPKGVPSRNGILWPERLRGVTVWLLILTLKRGA